MNPSKPAAVFSPTVSTFKIIGWSVRHTGNSLLESLAAAGQVIYYIHYPQLNTSYVAIKMFGAIRLSDHLHRQFASVQVELLRSYSFPTSEQGLECPMTTAFVSTASLPRETDLYKDLSKFGSLRALYFTYSNRSKKWMSKLVFYESYSLDRLLGHQLSVQRFLVDGSRFKVQRVRAQTKLCMPAYCKTLGTIKLASGQTRAAGSASQAQCEKQQKQSDTRVDNKQRRLKASNSCDKMSKVVLPHPTMFKSFEQYLENSISIARCHRNEQELVKRGTVLSVKAKQRSSSSDRSHESRGVFVRVSTVQDNRIKKERMGEAQFFNENEIYFAQIVNNTLPRALPSQKECPIPFDRVPGSYLSADDLSDGYSAQEEEEESTPVYTRASRDSSGKNISQVPLTMYSSGSDLSEAKVVSSGIQYRISFDNYLGSLSGQFLEEAVPQVHDYNCNYSKPSIDFFSYPCH